MRWVDILAQVPNPFLVTPTPDFSQLAGGGGGISNGTLLGFAGGAALALIPIVKSFIDNRNNMAARTTETTLATHTAMLTSAIVRADRLEAEMKDLQKAFSNMREQFATVKAQLEDKTKELEIVTHERDALRKENEELRATITRMELAVRAGGTQNREMK